MTREEKITSLKHLFMGGTSFEEVLKEAMDFADEHPHWISVEEQDIPLGQWVITYAPNEFIYCNINVELLAMDETAEDFGITHWMPLPSIEEIKGNLKKTSPNSNSISIDVFEEAAKGFKPYPLFSERMEKASKSDHFADVSQKVKKGGEE